MLVNAARYTARQFVGRVMEHFPNDPPYELIFHLVHGVRVLNGGSDAAFQQVRRNDAASPAGEMPPP